MTEDQIAIVERARVEVLKNWNVDDHPGVRDRVAAAPARVLNHIGIAEEYNAARDEKVLRLYGTIPRELCHVTQWRRR